MAQNVRDKGVKSTLVAPKLKRWRAETYGFGDHALNRNLQVKNYR
jgi:hypothetical protein